MLIPFACLLALTLLILWRSERTQARLLDHHAQASREWRTERSELLNRIQHPEFPILESEPGDVHYVDEAREWELSPSGGGDDS